MALKTSISFGLVNIPVVLNPVIRNNDASFNYLHKKCGERVSYVKYCPHCKVEVKQSDIIKGYQYSKDEYVTFDENDFEKLKSEDDKVLEVVSFIPLKDIDPVYFEKSYVLNTDKKNKAFSLFAKALNKAGKVALVKTIIGTKFYYAILRLGMNTVIMTTLYFDEEVRVDEAPVITNDFSTKEFDLAMELINNMSGSFEPEKYKDEYQDKVYDAIDKKIEGEEIKAPKKKRKESVTDLMDALEKSLKSKPRKKS